MNSAIDITSEQRKTLVDLLRQYIPGAAVWAYGSRIQWTARPNSDLDLVAFIEPSRKSRIEELKEALAESDLPFLVDLHVWDEIPDRFHEIIRSQYLVIQEEKDESINLFDLQIDGWEYATLGEICARGQGGVQTGPFGSQLHASDYVADGIPSIMPQNIGDNRIIRDGIARITLEDAERLERYRVRAGDIVYSRRGDVERRALVRKEEDGWLCGTGCLRVRFGGNDVNPAFASFYLGDPRVRAWIVRHAQGATMANLNTEILSALPFVVPPIGEQQFIAQTLSALDDKIERIRQMNETAEAMTRALFRSWFVDFDPVRAKAEGREPDGMDAASAALFPSEFENSSFGPLPVKWKRIGLGAISQVGIGKTPPRAQPQWFSESDADIVWVSIRDMGKPGVYIRTSSEFLTREAVERFNIRLVPDNTVIISFKLTVGRVAITEGQLTTNEAIAHCVLPVDACVTTEYLYCALAAFDFTSLASTSSIAEAVNSKTIREVKITVPERDAVDRYTSLTQPLFQKIKSGQKTIETLTQIRDTLLPRLISGKLRVPETEKLVEKML